MKPSYLVMLLICIATVPVQAVTRIAILDFELKDLTLAPGIPAELQRTASIKPLLEQELRAAGYEVVSIAADAQKNANSGEGYLFDHPDVAAHLGKQHHVDYVLVGRLHKPSFLFAYLMGHLVRVADERWAGQFIVESKGPGHELAVKAVESLTVKIDSVLDKQYVPPPPAKLIPAH